MRTLERPRKGSSLRKRERAAETDPGKEKPIIIGLDDNAGILDALRRCLRSEPYDFWGTCCPGQALDWIRECRVSALITDLRMPELYGTDVLREVSWISPRTVRIILTAYSDVAPHPEKSHGLVQHLIAKPWNDRSLRRLLRRAVKESADRGEK